MMTKVTAVEPIGHGTDHLPKGLLRPLGSGEWLTVAAITLIPTAQWTLCWPPTCYPATHK
jgi:hypothetical protein